ncbi:hypothetical protein MsAm2_06980 [Methanolapillus ohkumae]|uniref:Uncharacterized protein n=1 Tax=Methanolapillus ohkumae TaxID=3028298 RepID=A0AA96ZVJ5_9EURY|nr:hypothetical protein MsAm2_06980 [Methanosarcinaceae archaeon Am2]
MKQCIDIPKAKVWLNPIEMTAPGIFCLSGLNCRRMLYGTAFPKCLVPASRV